MNFIKSGFDFWGGYLSCNGKFVVRFKYMASRRSKFQAFLIKNFTVDEYFTRLDAGETPMDILKSKGYSSLSRKEQAEFERSLTNR
jgi:hypothetical protein